MKAFIDRRFKFWMARRLPPARAYYLNQRRLFIFPSRQGFGFLFLCCLIWLLGTNYENNLALAMCYFLVSLFILSIHHTFNNMSGLTVTAVSAGTCFSGENAEFDIVISRRGKRAYENIQLGWREGSTETLNLQGEAEQRLKLFVPATQRGWYNPGRLLLETVYPLGLIRCWTWLDLDLQALVYPEPISRGALRSVVSSSKQGATLSKDGSEDFIGFKQYQPGHSLRHVAWKQYARGQGLYLKDYGDYHSPNQWLDWDSLPGLGKEARLSALCYWALASERDAASQQYGLRLPGVEIAPSCGRSHQQAVLKALALC